MAARLDVLHACPERYSLAMDTRADLAERLENLAIRMDEIARSDGKFDTIYAVWCDAWPRISADVTGADRTWFDQMLLVTAQRVFNSALLDELIKERLVSAPLSPKVNE